MAVINNLDPSTQSSPGANPNRLCNGMGLFTPLSGVFNQTSTAGATPAFCWSNCDPCDFAWLIGLAALVIAFFCGGTFGRETAARYFSGEKSHKMRARSAILVLSLLVIFLVVIGFMSIGLLLLIAGVFAVGHMFSRSKANFNKQEPTFHIGYNHL